MQRDCQCGTYFQWSSQRCQFPTHFPPNNIEMCDLIVQNPPIPNPRPCTPTDFPPTPILPPFNPTCPAPDCTNPNNFEILHPIANDPTRFFQCGGDGSGIKSAVRIDCQCGTYFWYEEQRCEFISRMPQRFCNATPNPLPPPIACNNEELNPPITTPSTTTPPQNCIPCIPLWPCTCSCIGQTVCGCNGSNRCNISNNNGQNIFFGY